MDRLEIVASRISGEADFATVMKKDGFLGIGMTKMVTTGRSSMHPKKASLLSRQWGPPHTSWARSLPSHKGKGQDIRVFRPGIQPRGREANPGDTRSISRCLSNQKNTIFGVMNSSGRD
jgi:hypothetical protein